MVRKCLNVGDEIFDLLEGPATDGFLGDDAKPDLDLVQPGRIGWCVVDVVSRVYCDPVFDLGVLVRAVIIDDQVNVEIFRDVLVNVSEEL